MNISPIPRKLDAADIPPEQLAKHAQLSEEQKVVEATRQFEALLLRQILESTQKTVIQSSYSNDSTSATIYRDLVTCQLADSISKSGALGLAKTLETQFKRPSHVETAAEQQLKNEAQTADPAQLKQPTQNSKPVFLAWPHGPKEPSL